MTRPAIGALARDGRTGRRLDRRRRHSAPEPEPRALELGDPLLDDCVTRWSASTSRTSSGPLVTEAWYELSSQLPDGANPQLSVSCRRS
jgi:hypothetical protein